MPTAADSIPLRLATLDDVPALQVLIATSAEALAAGDYTEAQIAGALQVESTSS